MKRFTKIDLMKLLLLITCLFVLSACGETAEKTNGKQTGEKNEGQGETEKSNEPLQLDIQLEAWGTNFPKDDEVQAFIEETTNTNLDLTWIPYTDYEQRFNIQLSSKKLPDILANVMPSGQLYSTQVIQGINSGVFKDLTPFIEDPEFDKKYPNLAKYDDLVWESLRFNGKIYALPRYLEPLAGNSAVIIREDLLKKAGLEEPRTVEELEETLLTLSKEFGIYAIETTKKDLDSTSYKPLAVAFTGVQDWGIDEDGNFMFQSFMPEYRDFLLFFKRLFDAEAIDPEFALEQGGSAFKSGDSASMIHVWWNWKHGDNKSPFEEAFREKEPEAKALGLLPLEGPEASTVTIRTIQRPALINGNISDEDIPKILELFDYTASDEHRELTLYGLEGVHHEVKDGEKELIDKEKFDADAVGHWFVMFQNQVQTPEMMIEQAREDGVSESDLTRMKDIDELALEKAKEAKLGMPHWSVESETYFQKWGSLTRDLNENRINVIMGKMSIEQWDDYVKKIVESKDYQQILQEFKDGYAATN